MNPSDSNQGLVAAAAGGEGEGGVVEGAEEGDEEDDNASKPPVHPFTIFRKPVNSRMESEDKLECCISYLRKAEPCRWFSKPNKKLNTQKTPGCTCIQWLSDPDKEDEREAISYYMMCFYLKKKVDRQMLLMEWIRYTNDTTSSQLTSCSFYLPICDRPKDPTIGEDEREAFSNKVVVLKDYKICKSALGFILGFGKDAWRTCVKAVKTNSIPIHGIQARGIKNRSKQFEASIRPDLDKFMEEISNLAETRCTKAVRDEISGTTILVEAGDVKWLPPYMSKRGLYVQFCARRGWEMKQKAKCYKKTRLATIPDDEVKDIPEWSVFYRFWKREYPQLKIGKSCEDMCTKCHVFMNRFKYVAKKKEKEGQESDESDSEIEGEESLACLFVDIVDEKEKKKKRELAEEAAEATGETVPPIENDPPKTPAVEKLELEDLDSEISELVQEANLHVRQAKSQRALCQLKIVEAQEDFAANKPHSERRRTIVMDYSQNIDMPQVGESQPGRTYYYSPLRIYVFGIVECGKLGGELFSYLYHEGEGDKGGDQVASMVMLYLKQRGLLPDFHDDHEAGKELTIICDNCPGQNKNKTVLRLCVLLVETAYFEKVNVIFLIVGHTKNCCDRWFSIMKKDYRKKNLYTMGAVVKACNKHELVHIHRMEPGEFKYFSTWQDKYYKPLPAGKCLSGHIFTCSLLNYHTGINGCTTLIIKTDDLGTDDPTVADLASGVERKDGRIDQLRNFVGLQSIPEPGIPEIKQYELWHKWRQHVVPRKYWHITCPKPHDAVIRRVKQQPKSKGKKNPRAKKKQKTATKRTPAAKGKKKPPPQKPPEEPTPPNDEQMEGAPVVGDHIEAL
jgi:hypothetical protein